MIHIYYGSGKGKTTAAVGLAERAAGHGIPVLFAQFMKDGSSGEICMLEKNDRIKLLLPGVFYGFFSSMNEQQKCRMSDEYERQLQQAADFAAGCGGRCLVVLDEVLHAVKYGLLDEDRLCEFLSGISDMTEVVLTGAEPSSRLYEAADYVTCMRKEKHPYDRGVRAREGVEY